MTPLRSQDKTVERESEPFQWTHILLANGDTEDYITIAKHSQTSMTTSIQKFKSSEWNKGKQRVEGS